MSLPPSSPHQLTDWCIYWLWCHMIWNIPLVRWGSPVLAVFPPSLFASVAKWKGEKALALCNPCFAVRKPAWIQKHSCILDTVNKILPQAKPAQFFSILTPAWWKSKKKDLTCYKWKPYWMQQRLLLSCIRQKSKRIHVALLPSLVKAKSCLCQVNFSEWSFVGLSSFKIIVILADYNVHRYKMDGIFFFLQKW